MYCPGDEIKIPATFRNESGALADPTEVTCKARKPNGTVVSLEVVKDSTGLYHSLLTPSVGESGVWVIRWTGQGVVNISREKELFVELRRVI